MRHEAALAMGTADFLNVESVGSSGVHRWHGFGNDLLEIKVSVTSVCPRKCAQDVGAAASTHGGAAVLGDGNVELIADGLHTQRWLLWTGL